MFSQKISALFLAFVMSITFCSCVQFDRTCAEINGHKYANLKTGQKWTDRIPRFKPVKSEDKTAWISFRNMTQQNFDLETKLRRAVEARGYMLIDNPDEANFHIYYTMRFFGENDNIDGGQSMASKYRIERGRGGSWHPVQAPQGGTVDKTVEYDLVLDVDIAQWKEGIVRRKLQDLSKDKQTEKMVDITPVSEVSSSFENKRQEGQSYGEEDHYFWYVNTLILWAKQIRLSSDEAQPAIEEALVRSLPQFLP